MKSHKFAVGLTGGIASGKTTVANIFAQLGADIVDTDQIARSLLVPGTDVYEQVVRLVDDEYIHSDGQVDRRKLREAIFQDDVLRENINAIFHPAIRDKVVESLEKSESIYCIVVVPLLAETGNYSFLDRVITVRCPEEIQVARLIARDGVSKELAGKMIRAQVGDDQRLRLADDVIENTGSLEMLNEAVRGLHSRYVNSAKSR